MADIKRNIWKLQLQKTTRPQEFIVPGGSKFLDAQCQNDIICVWVGFNDAYPKLHNHPNEEIHTYYVALTGIEFGPEFGEYMATCQNQSQTEVYHIYKKP